MFGKTLQPHFLVMNQYHLSREKARAAVIDVLKRYGEVCPRERAWDTLQLKWTNETPPTTVTFRELVEEAQEKGAVVRIQKYLDKSDSIFGGSIDELSLANYQMSVNTAYAGWEKKTAGPCRTSSVAVDLMEDILEYRARTCEHSNEYDFRICCRYYRAYLSACLSLVDAFINRHVLIAEHDGFSSPEFDRLKATTSLVDRVCLLYQVCSGNDPGQVLQSVPWCQFQEIRRHRNEIIHAINPVYTYSLKEMWQFLNKVRTGIGELLLLLRHAHKKPTLLFIERLRSAPTVNFRQIHFRSDGRHVIKTLYG
jgi:hypothetical protein